MSVALGSNTGMLSIMSVDGEMHVAVRRPVIFKAGIGVFFCQYYQSNTTLALCAVDPQADSTVRLTDETCLDPEFLHQSEFHQ